MASERFAPADDAEVLHDDLAAQAVGRAKNAVFGIGVGRSDRLRFLELIGDGFGRVSLVRGRNRGSAGRRNDGQDRQNQGGRIDDRHPIELINNYI